VWSHAAWAQAIGVDSVPLLSDWNGDAVRLFNVAVELSGMSDVASRTSFLIEDGMRVRERWLNGRELPDLDAVIAAARG
jgi:peroxiredoxin